MFDNINWEKIINDVLTYIKKDWKYLIVKFSISKTSYSIKYYYSRNEIDYYDLYNEIDTKKSSLLMDTIKKITETFDVHKQKMFLTIKAEKSGNVKVIYKDIKNTKKLPYDEEIKYLKLNENDKIF